MMQESEAYRPSQIALHWLVVAGIVLQIAGHDPIQRQTEALLKGETPAPADAVLANAHVLGGSLVLLAVVVRLALRLRYGAPRHADGASPLQAWLAGAVHAALYAALFGVIATGLLTRTGAANLGGAHFAFVAALVVLAGGHAAAALFNQYVRRDGTLARMVPWLA